MFTGTLKFNLDPEKQVNDDRIYQILKAAQLDQVFEKDPQQRSLEMEITENGANLSSGEKQLICICRAILRVKYYFKFTLLLYYRKAKSLF
jgi:ABC-type multidrug transport system fused ATPase/permease subunit